MKCDHTVMQGHPLCIFQQAAAEVIQKQSKLPSAVSVDTREPGKRWPGTGGWDLMQVG